MSETVFDFGTLTDEQRAVVEHSLERPALVDAGAGTGKTHTIVGRVAYLHRTGRCDAKAILLLTFARKAAAELRKRTLEQLGPDVEPPQCLTFHAFAAGVLSDHAYDLRVSPDATVIEDLDARLLFRDAFEDVVYGSDVDASAFPLRPAQRDSLRDGLFAIAQRLKELEIPVDAFVERALKAADDIERIPARSIAPRAKKATQKRKPIIETTTQALMAEAADARDRARAAGEIFRRYDALLARAHALTYPDLLQLARQGIERDARLARELRGRYRYCIVDEFQDTDESQWRFLQTLFGEDLERVTVVGDPRQSIFGFRGATPRNVTRFGAIGSSTSYALAQNRRSRQEILDLAHAVIQPQTGDEEPLRAHRGMAGTQVVHLLSRWADEDNPEPNADTNRAAQAREVAARVAAMLAAGRRPKDIAILTRNKTLIQPFTAALNDVGVPFRLLGGAGFYEAPEVRDAMAWLELLADPLAGQAAARLAASPACGLSDATTTVLAASLENDQSAFARRLLVELLPDLDDDSQARIKGLRDLVDRLEPYASVSLGIALPKVFELTGLAEQLARSGDGQAAANIAKLERLASDFLARNREARIADFVHYVQELERIEFDDREADSLAAEAVTIMTVHAAKGLEWDVVFVIDVWPQPKASPLIELDLDTGALLCREGRDGTRLFHYEWATKHPDAEGLTPHEDEVEKGPSDEERRLFYVALTRARDELYILGWRQYSASNTGGRPHPFTLEVEEHLRSRGWSIDKRMPLTHSARVAEARASLAPAQTELWDGQRQSRAPVRSAVPAVLPLVVLPPLSFSTLHAFERCPRSVTYKLALRVPNVRPDARSGSDDALFDAASDLTDTGSLLAQSDYGRLVHRALERWARARSQGSATNAADAYVAAAASDLDIRPRQPQSAKAAADVTAAIGAIGAWSIERIEAPFSLQYGDAVVSGFIDLIARDAAGRALVLDYKTGETLAAEYALQLGIYRDAAERAYGMPQADCYIGRFSEHGFALEALDVPTPEELRERIAVVARGLRARDTTPRPGRWCYTCAYRAAPCDAYPKSERNDEVSDSRRSS